MLSFPQPRCQEPFGKVRRSFGVNTVVGHRAWSLQARGYTRREGMRRGRGLDREWTYATIHATLVYSRVKEVREGRKACRVPMLFESLTPTCRLPAGETFWRSPNPARVWLSGPPAIEAWFPSESDGAARITPEKPRGARMSSTSHNINTYNLCMQAPQNHFSERCHHGHGAPQL